MTRIIIREDCGNSPKNNLIQQFTAAIAKRDIQFILDHVTEDIRWNIVGSRFIEGKTHLLEFLKQAKKDEVVVLTIQHVVSHGKAGAVDGTQKHKNGEKAAFCNVYEFSNTKGTLISEIATYLITLK